MTKEKMQKKFWGNVYLHECIRAHNIVVVALEFDKNIHNSFDWIVFYYYAGENQNERPPMRASLDTFKMKVGYWGTCRSHRKRI